MYERCCGIDVHTKMIVKSLIEERSREINRLQKMQGGANIRLASFASDINGKSSRNILDALLAGKKLDENQLKELLHILESMQATEGILTPMQKYLIRNIIDHIDDMCKRIEDVDELSNELLQDYQQSIKRLDEIPGIGHQSAETIVIETGLDMSHFQQKGIYLVGQTCRQTIMKAQAKRKNGRTARGNKTLKTTLVQCAKTAFKKEVSYFHAQYQRLVVRRGKK